MKVRVSSEEADLLPASTGRPVPRICLHLLRVALLLLQLVDGAPVENRLPISEGNLPHGRTRWQAAGALAFTER